MKIVDAISNLERDTIIRHLAQHGKWRAVRGSAMVDLARFTAGGEIHYSVTLDRHLIVSARAKTVEAALDDVNAIIHRRALPPMAGRAADPRRRGVPQLVRQLPRHAGSESLWREA